MSEMNWWPIILISGNANDFSRIGLHGAPYGPDLMTYRDGNPNHAFRFKVRKKFGEFFKNDYKELQVNSR